MAHWIVLCRYLWHCVQGKRLWDRRDSGFEGGSIGWRWWGNISTSRGDGDSVYNHDQTVLRLLNSNSQEKSKTLSSVDHAIKSHFTWSKSVHYVHTSTRYNISVYVHNIWRSRSLLWSQVQGILESPPLGTYAVTIYVTVHSLTLVLFSSVHNNWLGCSQCCFEGDMSSEGTEAQEHCPVSASITMKV